IEFESAQSNTTAKLPILKLENGNSWVSIPQTAQENGTSVTKMSVPVTAEEKTNKKNDVKARSLLLMALPNEHQLTFSQYSDAKTMFAAIETRFRGNEATKKTQKTLLKQQYENFSASSTESLDSIFNRLQKIVSRLAILVWMNKANIKTTSIDDLYNNFKIVEQDVNKSVGASSGAQNLAFMTALSTSSTNDVNTANPAYEVSTVSPNINTACPQDLEQIYEDDLEAIDFKWQLSLLSMRAKECFNCHKMGHFTRECRAPRNKEGQFRYQDNTMKQGNNKDASSKAMLAIDGVDSEVYNDKTCTKTCLKNYETLKKLCDDLIVKLNQTEFTAATYKRGLATIEEQLVTYRKNEVLFSEEVTVLKREVACKDYEINVLKSEFEKVKQEKEGYNVVPPPHPLIYNRPKKLDLSYSGLDEFKDPEFKSYGSKDSKLESNIVCDTKSDDSKENSDDSLVKEQVSDDAKNKYYKTRINYDNHQRKGIVSRNNYSRVDAKTTHPSVQRNMSPKAVLLKTGLTPLNTVRPVNTTHPKTAVHSAKSKTYFFKQAQSTAKRPFYKQTALTRRSLHTAKRHYYNGRPRAVNTVRSYTGQVNVVRVKGVNAVKSSAYWVWRPTKPNGASLAFKIHNYIDAQGRSNGCSRYMTENIAYLSDFKEFDGGYVAFGGGAYGGRITGKGTLLKLIDLEF
ncbi:putative ribonuclease H-like domain-containing protein, partial [Tanacetum coccineum]